MAEEQNLQEVQTTGKEFDVDLEKIMKKLDRERGDST